MVFGLQSVSPQPMLLCVNVIAQIKFIDLKMNLGCSIFIKGRSILNQLVSEVGVFYIEELKREWQIEGLFQTFVIFQKS